MKSCIEYISVPSGEYKKVEYNRDKVHEVLVSDGADPCHLIGIINVSKNIAYLGHFYADSTFAEDFIRLAAKEADDDLSSLRIALAGNGIEEDALRISMEQYLFEIVRAVGIERKSVKNNLASKAEAGHFVYGMEVDPNRRTIKVFKNPIDE